MVLSGLSELDEGIGSIENVDNNNITVRKLITLFIA
jgi:hypothetical protein